jgi:hypothetical protein
MGATVIGLVALTVVRRFEDKDGLVRCRVAVTTTGGPPAVSGLVGALRGEGCKVTPAEYESAPGEGRSTVTLDVHAPATVAGDALVRVLERQPGVTHVRISGST